MEIAYFLGCIMNNRYPGVEKATRKLFEALDIELKDMEGASCCPAPGVFGSFDEETWATIAARNLTLAEDMGADIMTECNGCFGSLFECNHILKEDEDKKAKINANLAEIGREFKGTTNVKHFAQILRDDVGFEKLASLIEKPLDLNVAVHYGCHFLKPTETIGIEDQAENPSILDDLVEITGAKSVDYKDKMMCCGAGGGLRARDKDVTTSFTKEKLDHMTAAGVDAIATDDSGYPTDETLRTGCTMKVTDIGIMSIQAGANEGQQINIDIPKVDVHTLDLDLINVNTGSGAADAIRKIDHAIFKVSSSRSELGAYQNRLERTTDSLDEYHENITTALSRIEDCDMAEEMTNFTAENVKTQAATSILAQANERPQTILQLLQ